MTQKSLHVTILGGKFKGKKLFLPSKDTTRSTKAILKSSFFNTVQFDIIDATFIEAFAGSGSMGLEALSRGAKKAYFIEKDKAAFGTLKRNCENVDALKTICFLDDTFIRLPQIAQSLEKAAFFYFDPPFDIRDGMSDIYEKAIELFASLPKSKVKLAAFEHVSAFEMPNFIKDFKLLKRKTFGNSSISYYM